MHTDRNKFETLAKWIIPIISIILQVITIGYSLGLDIDIRKACALIIGFMFLATGNCLSKLDYINNYDIETEKARKINRFFGFETGIMGLLSIISTFFPPIVSVIWLFFLIPYTAIAIWYKVSSW